MPIGYFRAGARVAAVIGRQIGAYRIVDKLGEGGMGEVYRAHDTRLDRPVALKLLPLDVVTDADRLRRFHEEARAVSSLNHPHILVIHDFGDVDGRPFIVSELVEGETLRQRMARGPLAMHDVVDISLQLASALAAAHARGIVHRDVKPENVMLRPDGYVKLLDFGLARRTSPAATSDDTETLLQTEPGLLVGTPRYMSPEQARGKALDARSDVWSLGVLMYEVLSGRPPFDGMTIADTVAAILRTDPPPIELQAPHVTEPLAAVIRCAVAKEPADRFASAQELHNALAAARDNVASGHQAPAPSTTHGRTRVVVLPLRILKADPDTDFLAFSLPDAVAASLANLESLVVRSSLAAGVTPTADLRTIARQASVEMIVVGTMVRAGGHLRVTAQLVEGVSGTLVWSHAAEVALGDLFRLQDLLVDGIVKSLALPLTGRDRQQLRRDAPASAKAYEHYLRANELAQRPREWAVARELYLQAIDLDPQFAPAWARLARLYRLMAKYESGSSAASLTRAEDALRQALRLNPDLSIAHHLSAQIEIDAGRADEAMRRLLARARDRPDAQLYAALVHTCRVCGLIAESLAAHQRARQIDPAIETGVMHTYWLLHRYQDALATSEVKAYVAPASLVELGRIDEARALIAELEVSSGNRVPALAQAVRAFIDGRHDEGVRALIAQTKTTAVPDPEMLFYVGRHLAHVGELGDAMVFIHRAVEGGYGCYTVFATDAWLDSVRSEPAFGALLETVRVRSERARDIFVEAGGPALLGAPQT